ncbi:MAG: Cytidylate kinase [Verrucomicrobiota bacterium]
MLVAIDAWAGISAYGSAWWVARALSGSLVDTNLLLRGLLKSAVEARVDLRHPSAVQSFCDRATVQTRFSPRSNRFQEMELAVNGHWFSRMELEHVPSPTSIWPAFAPLHDMIRHLLPAIPQNGRAVMLGRDVGRSLFPDTPFKFFFHTTAHPDSSEAHTYPELQPPSRTEHYCVVRTWRGFKILMIDAARLPASEAGGIILAECTLRATEARPED